jgi:hypothetical protein
MDAKATAKLLFNEERANDTSIPSFVDDLKSLNWTFKPVYYNDSKDMEVTRLVLGVKVVDSTDVLSYDTIEQETYVETDDIPLTIDTTIQFKPAILIQINDYGDLKNRIMSELLGNAVMEHPILSSTVMGPGDVMIQHQEFPVTGTIHDFVEAVDVKCPFEYDDLDEIQKIELSEKQSKELVNKDRLFAIYKLIMGGVMKPDVGGFFSDQVSQKTLLTVDSKYFVNAIILKTNRCFMWRGRKHKIKFRRLLDLYQGYTDVKEGEEHGSNGRGANGGAIVYNRSITRMVKFRQMKIYGMCDHKIYSCTVTRNSKYSFLIISTG